METPLITGATGFLGRDVVHELLGRDAQVQIVCLIRARDEAELQRRRQRVVDGLPAAQADRVTALRGDIELPRLGLDEATARALVLQTAKGAALLAEEAAGRGETPDILRKKVTSPGGTTEAALKVFGEYSFGPMVRQALLAAARRSRELSA
ncbi:MAG TPA: pyrroline-5-carboxylate reductase dimerization domain-containing protein [Anaerohalosphaeraceae bacterium]|nr:pyrroline-5-carboxylate reductase dimerization domain-containing protein [Anaerohalosphaeraceae bacterium]